jgi:hypothetical protein
MRLRARAMGRWRRPCRYRAFCLIPIERFAFDDDGHADYLDDLAT